MDPSPEDLERRRWFEWYVEQQASNSVCSPEGDVGPFRCPCCGFLTLDERGGYDICPVCFWEDDGQDDHDADVVRGGPNGRLSLTQARANFRQFGACEERSIDNVRSPRAGELPSPEERVRAASMTEAEWSACVSPERLLDFLTIILSGRASGRRVHLFACGCVRRVWHLLVDERGQQAVVTAERFAEGEGTEEELEAACGAALEASGKAPSPAMEAAALAALYLATTRSRKAAWDASEEAAVAEGRASGDGAYSAARAAQCDLLRDIFGNPFGPPPAIDAAWLTWHGGLVVSMARRMYDTRDFTDMAVLADALEEAGCTNPDLLAHCRKGGTHVRGCWVVDLLLGKE